MNSFPPPYLNFNPTGQNIFDNLGKADLWGQDAPLEEDVFEREPELIFEQARRVWLFSLQNEYFLVFERAREILDDGALIDGSQIVVYDCDENGRVFNWQRRGVVEALDFHVALVKFRFLRANDLLCYDNFED